MGHVAPGQLQFQAGSGISARFRLVLLLHGSARGFLGPPQFEVPGFSGPPGFSGVFVFLSFA